MDDGWCLEKDTYRAVGAHQTVKVGNHWPSGYELCFFFLEASCSFHQTEIKSSSKPHLMETNTNGKHHVIIFCLLIKSSCPEGTAFYTQGLFNKQVCLTYSAQPVPGLGLAGCYWLQPAAQAGFCALGSRPHWWLSWPVARTLKPPASYRTGSCTRLWVNTAASKYLHQKSISEFKIPQITCLLNYMHTVVSW